MSQAASSTPPSQTRHVHSGLAKSPRQVKLQRIKRTKEELLALQRQGYGIDDHFLNSLEYSKVQANAVILLVAGFIFFSSGLRKSVELWIPFINSDGLCTISLSAVFLAIWNISSSLISACHRVFYARGTRGQVIVPAESQPSSVTPRNVIREYPMPSPFAAPVQRAESAEMDVASGGAPFQTSTLARSASSTLTPVLPSRQFSRPPSTAMRSSVSGMEPYSSGIRQSSSPLARTSPLVSQRAPKSPEVITSKGTPGFSDIYGTPKRKDLRSTFIQDQQQRVAEKSDDEVTAPTDATRLARHHLPSSPLREASSPLPYTGSPKLNMLAMEQLPAWTEQLRQTIMASMVGKSKGRGAAAAATSAVGSTPLARAISEQDLFSLSGQGKVIEDDESQQQTVDAPMIVTQKLSRTLYSPEQSVQVLGMSRVMDDVVENVRLWFARQILRPLSQQILELQEEFSRRNLDYLGPQCPATFSAPSLRAPSTPGTPLALSSFVISPMAAAGSAGASGGLAAASNAGAASSRPQTLYELAQQHPQDENVIARLKLEQRLAFAGTMAQRGAVIRKIHNLAADDGLLSSFCWSIPQLMEGSTSAAAVRKAKGDKSSETTMSLDALSSSEGSLILTDDDTVLLMNLFCTFMDQVLPSEESLDSAPFSSKFFVALGDKPSTRPEALQLQHFGKQPFHMRFVANAFIFDTHPGGQSLFHAIAYLIEYVHRFHDGYLGIGNLASPAIDLVSVLSFSKL